MRQQEHRRALEAANPAVNGRQVGQRAWSRACREERQRAQEHGRAFARRGDPLRCAGCMLYWGEGSKAGNGVAVTNADIDMLRLFRRFLLECTACATTQCGSGSILHLGTAQLRVGSTWIVQSIYGAIQEYAACARDEWLDLGLEPSDDSR